VKIVIRKQHLMQQHHFRIVVKSSLGIVFQYDGDVEVSLFNRGRMLIKNGEDEESALKVYNRVIEKIGSKNLSVN